MRNLNNFRLLQINIDIDCFKSEIKNNQSLWDSNVLRQTTLNTQKMTKAIPLFVAKPPFYFFLKQHITCTTCFAKCWEKQLKLIKCD